MNFEQDFPTPHVGYRVVVSDNKNCLQKIPKKDGSGSIYKQTVYIEGVPGTPARFPLDMTHFDEKDVYPPGEYTCLPSLTSIKEGDFNNNSVKIDSVNRLKLHPLNGEVSNLITSPPPINDTKETEHLKSEPEQKSASVLGRALGR